MIPVVYITQPSQDLALASSVPNPPHQLQGPLIRGCRRPIRAAGEGRGRVRPLRLDGANGVGGVLFIKAREGPRIGGWGELARSLQGARVMRSGLKVGKRVRGPIASQGAGVP